MLSITNMNRKIVSITATSELLLMGILIMLLFRDKIVSVDCICVGRL